MGRFGPPSPPPSPAVAVPQSALDAELFTEHTAPELLYLETRWASLISFSMTVALLKDILPIASTTKPETVRQHLHKVATRQDAELGTAILREAVVV